MHTRLYFEQSRNKFDTEVKGRSSTQYAFSQVGGCAIYANFVSHPENIFHTKNLSYLSMYTYQYHLVCPYNVHLGKLT